MTALIGNPELAENPERRVEIGLYLHKMNKTLTFVQEFFVGAISPQDDLEVVRKIFADTMAVNVPYIAIEVAVSGHRTQDEPTVKRFAGSRLEDFWEHVSDYVNEIAVACVVRDQIPSL
jgi:hypothetical protein